jgi:hypothetical protein
MHNDALTHAANVLNHTADSPATKTIDPRHDRNRPPPARDALDIVNAQTDNAQNTAPHRFNFR